MWWRRKRRDEDIERELRSDLELESAEQQEKGLTPEEARYAAQRAFGNSTLVKEDVHGVWRWAFVEHLWQDMRYAARTLKRSPGFAFATIITLSLGIGANTTIFSAVNSVVLRPLPFHDPGRLMMLDEKWLPRFPHFEATANDFLSWRKETHAFEQIAAFAGVPFDLSGGDRPERISGVRVSANLPDLLGVRPVLGRSFRPEEDIAGRDRVVLLGYSLWRQRFGGNPAILGTAIRLNDIDFTVIGIMPASFRFPRDAQIWKPMGFTPSDFNGDHFVWAIGRLKPGIARDQAQAEMDVIMKRLHQPQVWSANVFPVLDYYVGEVKIALYVLLGSAGFLLLIACVNVANLLLARGSARYREISVRASLGAGRGRIVRQLLTETLLLSFAGGALGLLIAFGTTVALRRFSLSSIPRLNEVTLDPAVLLFTLLISTLTGLLFGVSPAIRLARVDLRSSLNTGVRVAGTKTRVDLRSALVTSEVALALVLLTGAGLLFKSFWRLLEVRPGFDTANLLTASIDLPEAKYGEPYRRAQFVQQVLGELGHLPGVRQAAVSDSVPFSDVTDVGIRFDARAAGAPDAGTTANYYAVSPGYFRTMAIPLIRGRLFTDHDAAAAPPVVIINETMAKRFFPNEDPIGKRLDISGPTYLRQIVGVVGDVKQAGLKASIPPQVYEPFLQKPSNSFTIVIRSFGDPMHLAESVRQQVQAIDADQPISNVKTMDDIVATSLTQDRLSTVLLGLFALLALVLAALGVYGVIAYSVTQRTHEIGVRIALGARQSGILSLVLTRSFQVVLAGLVIGFGASILLTRVMAALLYNVTATDPITHLVVSSVLLVVALAAAFIPAWRASRVDPMKALKYE